MALLVFSHGLITPGGILASLSAPDSKNKVTHARVNPDSLHVSVSLFRLKSPRNCGEGAYAYLLGDEL